MNRIVKKLILLAMFAGCCATLLLTWTSVHNVQTLDGTSILTGNLYLTLLIFATYGTSILFYEKHPKVFFSMGLSSLSMLFAIMFSKFESWGRFANTCAGPYIGLTMVVCTILVYVLLELPQKEK
ncbi:MAG: hypothetical protein IKY59_04600 [Oscillospiraceae bacterium]|nr:hypothetical protein [Oscillospiraceae bacterium]